MLPTGVAASTSPSPAKVPPKILTVALARFGLSRSVTVMAGDSVVVLPWVKAIVDATLVRLGGTLAMSTVVVTTVLRLFEPEPSLSVHVMLRVVLEPKLLGLAPDAKETSSSRVW